MDDKKLDIHCIRNEIINAFRPIEQLFKIMDTSSVEVYGELTRSAAEVGITLCQNFRNKVDIILDSHPQGEKDGRG